MFNILILRDLFEQTDTICSLSLYWDLLMAGWCTLFKKGFETTFRLSIQDCHDQSMVSALNMKLGSGSPRVS